ncbi:MAG: gliding motility-associated C-terminal domain-containing protein [Weeksellaceae bacterium]|nr:gliding motility-associated C-terminal domain-containing protein [Bacteroidota bacterium]MCG2781654.1 gliding motility-associated C-terminal domain-containing protein [Weeksellaceae bacterium]
MKKSLLILLLFVSIFSSAQLDREHWFGPMVDRVNSFGSVNSDSQSIYMSTGETTPFKVEVYFNNAVVATFTLSKNNPQKYTVSTADRERIIINPGWLSDPAAGLFQPVTMGFYLKGEKPFFASMRFSIFNHAEIITSKGTAALGTEFRVATAPLAFATGTLNFMNSVMATENNTTVTVSEFQPDVIFTDEIPRTQITFVLNKGQSYIIEGSDSYYENQTGYIGAKIIADKPVVVTNGNFNGQYAQNIGSSDILMDQAVPINKLGKTFVLVKGNGENSYTASGNLTTMEKAIIVAVKNNTKIYLNGDPVPTATLQEGEFFTTPPNSYVDQGSGHFNMYISSSEDIYVYQLLAGSVGHVSNPNGEATGGFNYIPPLSCYLPRKIDEIGLIDENFFKSNSNLNGILNIPTKLNVITEKGAIIDIKRNGVSLPINNVNGPYNVSGNSDWQTYSFPNISGNISVVSSKAVTAGISAGDDAVGYGGFFAGFSATPLITKVEGECLPDDVKLAVTEGFSNYQWLQKVGNTYINAPVSPKNPSNTDYFYYPSQAGIYAAKIQQGSCAEIQTEDFKFFNCTNYTNYNYTICSDLKISPKFALSTQTVNPSSVSVTIPPTKGTVTIAADGSINYSAFKNASGTDTFRFAFCGVGAIPDCEVIQATIQLNQVISHDVVLKKCSLTNNAIFNLTEAIVTPDTAAQKKYYSDSALKNLIPNNLLANYPAANGDLVYVHLKNIFGCEATAVITLETNLPPAVNENLYTKTHCDEDIDGIIDGKYKVDLNSITPIVVPNSSGLTVRYYENEAKANIGGADHITGIYTFAAGNTEVWIRVDAPNVCPPAIRKIVLNIGTKLTINNTVSDFACDNDLDNKININLASYISLFTAGSNITAKYFDDLTKAQNNFAGENIPVDQIINGNRIFYYRLKKQGFCEVIGTLNLTLRQPKKSADLVNKEICAGTKTSLDAGSGFDGYLWSTGETTRMIHNVPIDDYWVDLYFNDCVYRQNVSVTPVALPEIVSIDIQGATVSINLSGGNPPYQYAIDNLNYQSSNVFLNVPGGDHTIYVISADNCIPVSADINVIQLYNAITPNGDGFNDVLNYSGLLKKNEPFMQIFDRYGKTVFTGDTNNRFTWDGKSSGKTLKTGSYWYVMHWKEPGFETVTQYTGWVLIKNRE